MAIVKVTVTTSAVDQPSSTAAQGGIVITLSNGAAPQTIAAAPYEVVFNDVAVGSYTFTAQAVDVNGNAVGAAITSESFTVAAPVVYNMPSGITVSVA